jgi:hypothetical protein
MVAAAMAPQRSRFRCSGPQSPSMRKFEKPIAAWSRWCVAVVGRLRCGSSAGGSRPVLHFNLCSQCAYVRLCLCVAVVAWHDGSPLTTACTGTMLKPECASSSGGCSNSSSNRNNRNSSSRQTLRQQPYAAKWPT